MKATITFILLILLLIQLNFSNTNDVDRSAEIAKIGSETITLGELIDNFKINLTEDEVSAEELNEFLPSYIEYRLKLKKGLQLGLDHDADLLEEFELYGRQAAEIFWLENELKEQIIEEYLNRSNYELLAFHILIEVPDGSTEYERNDIYDRLLDAREELINGTDPDFVNQNYSSIRNGNSMGGQLPWITAGRTVKPFEDGLYSLNVGEVSKPIRSDFGYHVIYLQDMRDRLPDRQVSHIFFQDTEESQAAEKAADVHSKLKDGLPWNEAVEEFSMDRSAAARGGLIGWVGYAMQFPEPFVDAVMETDPEVAFSEPIQMPYGFHIIRVDSVRTHSSEEMRREEIIAELERLQRLNPSESDIIEALKMEGNFTVNEELLSNIHTADRDEIVISFNGKEFTAGDYRNFTNANDFDYKEFVKETVLSDMIEITRSKFPEFDDQMATFLDGLIVFRINEKYIWSENAADRNDLESFYKKNMQDYWFDRSYTYYSISAFSDSVISDAHNLVANGIHPEELSEQLEDINVRRFSTSNRNNPGFELIEAIEISQITDIQVSGVRHSFFYLEDVDEPRQMTFEEAFSRVANDYIPIHEAQFIENLKAEFGVEMFPDNIEI